MKNVLDLRGLKCPLPALLARRAMKRTMPGSVIDIVVDDPMARIDIPHMCRQEGYDIERIEEYQTCIRITLRRPD